MIDRYTVFSYSLEVEKLIFVEKGKPDYFVANGVKTSYGIEGVYFGGKKYNRK
jgi:hypothetical protein